MRKRWGVRPTALALAAVAAVRGVRGAGRGWRMHKVAVGPSVVRVLDRMPLIAYEFGLEPCGDPRQRRRAGFGLSSRCKTAPQFTGERRHRG